MATKVYDRRNRIPSSSSPIGDDDDLVVEILIRLPNPKSAFRCRPVRKSWNALISTPYFYRRFVSHHQTLSSASAAAAADDDEESEPPVLTLPELRKSILSFLPFPPNTESKFSVFDSFKDLCLLGFREREGDDPELRRTYLVCNPVTKRWAALPLAPETTARQSASGWIARLACKPFDFDSPCRFRVVRMYDSEEESSLVSQTIDVTMFCSTSERWTNFALRLYGDLQCYLYFREVSANGKLYTWNFNQRLVRWDPFCLDHGGELVPTLLDVSRSDMGYGPWVSEGAVHMIDHRTTEDEGFIVWRLDEDEKGGGVWRKHYEVLCEGLVELEGFCDLGPFGLHPEKSEIMFFHGLRKCDLELVWVSWNFRKKEMEFLPYQDTAGLQLDFYEEWVFQPRVAFWPTLIPGHAKLRNAYDESYNCWLPLSNQLTT